MKKYHFMYLKFLIFSLSVFMLASCKNKPLQEKSTSKIIITTSSPIVNANNSYFSTSGKIEAIQNAIISTRLMGTITSVNVKIGNRVRKGQLLLRINSQDLQAKKKQAKAGIIKANTAFLNAQKDYNRFQKLIKEQSASEKEFDDIKTRFEISKANLEAANQQLNEVNALLAYADIKAPFNGTITSKMVNVGDLTNPGMPLLSIENSSSYEVKTLLTELQVAQIKIGNKVAVTIKSSNKKLAGIVSEVSSSSQPTGGLYLVKVKLKNSVINNHLGGSYVSVKFNTNNKKASSFILIAKKALVHNGQLTGIYTVSKSNTAILRWLRLGNTYGNMVEVLSGLNKNEKYITSANGKLYNGVSVALK